MYVTSSEMDEFIQKALAMYRNYDATEFLKLSKDS